MRKQIQVFARQFCTGKDLNLKLDKLNVETRTFEFEQFKFGIERTAMIHGYTMEEMYGRYYGLKHSPAMQKELSKDNIVVVLLFLIAGGVLFHQHQWSKADERGWQAYYWSDLPVVRNNL